MGYEKEDFRTRVRRKGPEEELCVCGEPWTENFDVFLFERRLVISWMSGRLEKVPYRSFTCKVSVGIRENKDRVVKVITG